MAGDATRPEGWWDGQPFDRILLDAPCSAVGVIRRHPDIKVLRRPEDVARAVELQARLLQALWPLLRPGRASRLRDMFGAAARKRRADRRVSARGRRPEAGQEPTQLSRCQTLPGDADGDGFYYACLLKPDTPPRARCIPHSNNRLPRFADGRSRLLVVAALLVLSLPLGARAQDFAAPKAAPPPAPVNGEEDPGCFKIREASTQLDAGVYFLNAMIEYRLSSEARAALQSGVPLTIRLEVELLNNRRFWFDNEDAGLRQLYQLEYHALSERYIVQNLNSGDQTSFSTLNAALDWLGHVNHLPLIDAALIEPGHEYYARMRAALDAEKLPGPLD